MTKERDPLTAPDSMTILGMDLDPKYWGRPKQEVATAQAAAWELLRTHRISSVHLNEYTFRIMNQGLDAVARELQALLAVMLNWSRASQLRATELFFTDVCEPYFPADRPGRSG